MCRIVEEIVKEERYEERIEMACRLIEMNVLSAEDIAKAASLPLEKVKELMEGRSA